MTRWYPEPELDRIGKELEHLARVGELSPCLYGLDAVERLYGPIETLRASGRSLEVVAADLHDLGFHIAASTLGASLRAIRARAAADLDRVFSELDVSEFFEAVSDLRPPHPVVEQPAPLEASIDSDFDGWFRAAPL